MSSVSMPESQSLSDKIYWHGYIPFYEKFFSGRNFLNIAEFGVFKGNSIRWLLRRFPDSSIYGADILPLQSEWPVDPRFHFTQLDQESRVEIHHFLNQCKFDLIIEDGSHQPQHQINCLIEGLNVLSSNGIYILEDIDTSLPSHGWWHPKLHWWKFKEKKLLKLQKRMLSQGNALHALLGIDHYKRIGINVDDEIASLLARNSLLTKFEILRLSSQIDSIHLYRRTHLPDYCHQCGSKDFNYSQLQCLCGQPIFSNTDSMSFVIIKKCSV